VTHLCDQLNNTTGLGDLSLSLLADPSGANDQWDLWESTLSEDLGVSEWEKVEDWDGVLLGISGKVLLTLLDWDKGPEL